MAIASEWIHHGPERHTGLLCYPERAALPLPAVLVIQEIWGVDAHIEDVTRRFAGAGYAAYAPDLYAEQGKRPPALSRERISEAQAFMNTMPPQAWGDPQAREAALAQKPEPERTRVGETMAAFFAGRGGAGPDPKVAKLLAATRWLRTECAASRGQKIGSVGFCMGGGLSALLACHDPDLAAAVVFYGAAPPSELLPNVRCPVLGHYGELDKRITDAVPAFAEAMRRAGKSYEPHVYPGAPHAFFNDGRPSYHARAAREAFVRTLELFRDALT